MVTAKKYESASVAAKWWVDVIQNGLKQNLPNNLQALHELMSKKLSYPQKTYLKFQKEVVKQVSKSLNEFGLVTLYTKTYPEQLLAECAKEAIILYKLDNPFPQNVTMQITKESVVVKGQNFHQVLFNEKQIER
jgi:hypothetical protein